MQKSKGLTFIGMLFTMTAVIILGILALRIAPVYIEHYSVVRALTSIAKLPNTDITTDLAANETVIRRSLMKQFEIDNVDSITETNITVSPQGEDKQIVTIQYQVIRPFIGNISLLLTFNNSQEVSIGRE
jgi:hypothetical protein